MSGVDVGRSGINPPRFGGAVPDAADSRLREANAAFADTDRAEALLREAHALAPQCLPVYFALYKFYFYKKRLADAEVAALQGLEAAARQAGIAADWNLLGAQSTAWADTTGPQHFYLFSLKALAFIRLRLGRVQDATALLDKLNELDPQDSVGAAVVRALAISLS
jgi:tetratricopeptide (TPR) repeat protein